MFTDDMERAAAVPDDVSDSMLMEMEVRKLKVVLEKIPVDDHAILLMKYQDDMSIKDISENLDKTESAVKMKLKRAKEKAVMVYKELYPEN